MLPSETDSSFPSVSNSGPISANMVHFGSGKNDFHLPPWADEGTATRKAHEVVARQTAELFAAKKNIAGLNRKIEDQTATHSELFKVKNSETSTLRANLAKIRSLAE
ncbi:hypothetical protein CF326_g6755 [Tilletia indica]|nr:hypothetical protein CF326_g6755 [Tilletia indica]